MQDICADAENRVVYPVLIKYNGKNYITLYYYTAHSDLILHNEAKRILYFQSPQDMERFCEMNALTVGYDLVEYDFDTPITNPIHYQQVLDNWNMLNTIAGTFGMFFEGDSDRYNGLYNLLFRLNTPVEPIPPTYYVSDRQLKNILKIFRKKDRFIQRFELYRE